MIEEISSQEKAEALLQLIGIIFLIVAFIDDTPKGRVIIKGAFFLIGIVLIGLFTNFIIKTM